MKTKSILKNTFTRIAMTLFVVLLFVAGAKAQNDTPLTFEAIAAGTVTLEKVGDFTPNSGVQYRMNETGDWLSYSYGTGISIQAGDKLQFLSTSSDAYSIDRENYSHFTCTADCYLYGSVGALFNNANSLPRNACSKLFYGNTHIKNHAYKRLVLPATSLGNACCEEMFSGCTSLTSAPALPATSLADFCYNGMFSGCTSLTSAPALPATSLAELCYAEMFSGCISLTSAPELPAKSLAESCYELMFSGCTSLTSAPELPATSLATDCYAEMFYGCTSLTSAPELLAATLVYGCYFQMFKGCTHLNYMTCLATNISADYSTTEWLSGVASTGTFVKNPVMTGWPFGDSGIPQGWTVVDYNNSMDCLTFQAVEAGTITVNLDSGATLEAIQYKLNNNAWTNVAWNTPIALSANDVIHFRGNNGTCYDETNQAGFRFACSNNCYVYGNLMSLIDQYGFETDTTLTQSRAFYRLFQTSEPNTTLLSHPSFDVVLPTTTLPPYCYCGLFGNCQGITRAPALPAKTMQEGCYFEMFYECAALNTPPTLPATTLAGYCYYNMFAGCTSLATAPELPATTIASNCYYNMFSRCTNLTAAPELPATQLQDRCYSGMFQGCTNLTTAPTLPATTLAEYCYEGMFKDCIFLATAPTLPATTLTDHCYKGMFNGCIRLTTAPALPATTLKNNCYEGMFNGCKLLKTAPVLPATTLADYCYYEMFRGCTALTTAPALPATTLSDYCYQRMFYKCSNLNYVVCLATDIPSSNCVKNWLYQVASSGTFVKAPNMTSWTTNSANGIPSGWTVNTMDNIFTTEGNWNVAANWSNNAVPAAGSSVVIAANATIPSGYVADAKCIIVNEGKTLTIADGGQLIHDNMVNATLQKGITGFGNDNNVETGWFTIASSVTGDYSTEGITVGNYDLYCYNEPTHYWWNAKDNSQNGHCFNTLRNGKGYLYANGADQTLAFTGPTQATNASVTIPLSYTPDAGDLKGFNLVGNPFTCNVTHGNVTLDGQTLSMYYIVDGGSELAPVALSERAIKPGEGFFVQATAANQQLVFNPTPTRGETPAQPAYIRIEAGNDNFMDRAYVQIGQGNTLRKMSLNDNTSKVYVMNDGMDYAAATINIAEGEMPVNFKAAENGEYTLSVSESLNSKFLINSVEGCAVLNYLHLIDNLTGADINLLETPSYTFSARADDYASRFKLVFSTQSDSEETDNDHFAFISNGNIIVDGEGMLQIIDALGRIVVSEQLSTPNSKLSTLNFTQGVYVLRLINGENVKTQKMIID